MKRKIALIISAAVLTALFCGSSARIAEADELSACEQTVLMTELDFVPCSALPDMTLLLFVPHSVTPDTTESMTQLFFSPYSPQ